jgi:hypothetical protein
VFASTALRRKKKNTFVSQAPDGRLSIEWERVKSGGHAKVNTAFEIFVVDKDNNNFLI